MIEVRPVREDERSAMDLVIDRSFSQDPVHPTHQGFFHQFQYLPMARSDFYWGVFVDGKPVAGLMLVPFEILIDSTPLHLVGLTGVGTDPNYRHQGYSLRLLQAVHEFLLNEGFDGAILHSAADMLYLKAGYELCFMHYKMCFEWKPSILPKILPMIEPIKKTHTRIQFYIAIDFSDALVYDLNYIFTHDIEYHLQFVKTQRNLLYFRTKLQELMIKGAQIVVLYRDDMPFAFMRYHLDKQTLSIDNFYAVYNHSLALLILIEAFMNELELKEASIEIHQKPIMGFKPIMDKIDVKVMENPLTGNMAIIFDPFRLLHQMQGTFSKRIAESIFSNSHVQIPLQIEQNRGYIQIDNHCVTIHKTDSLPSANPILISTREFNTMVFGYLPVDAILDHKFDKLAKEIRDLLQILFPCLHPMWDSFDSY